MQEMLMVTPRDAGGVEYVRTMPEGDFATFASLQAELSPEFNLNKAATYKYFVYKKKGKEIIVPSQPVGRGTYNGVYNRGAVFGVDGPGQVPQGLTAVPQSRTFIAANGKTYRVRLMEGVPGDTYPTVTNMDYPNFDPVPEFDYFVLNLWVLDATTKAKVYFKDLNVPESEKVVKSKFTAANSRSWGLVKGSVNQYAITRARYDNTYPDTATYAFNFSQFASNSALLTSTNGIWWPVFEEI
jgi:hypothetical protein